MQYKIISSISIGLLLSCTTFISISEAQDYVKTSQINASNGVAGLNINQQATADISNNNIQISQLKISDIQTSQLKIGNQYKGKDGSIINRPLIQFVPDQPFAAPTIASDGVQHSSLTLGKEMVQIGGAYDSNNQAVPMSLSVTGRPYGNFNAGCTLCVFSTDSGMFGGGAQAALSGLDFHGGPGYNAADAVANGDFATAGFYQYDENYPGRVVAQVSSFDKGEVTLAREMTEEEMSKLHEGMYIATNIFEKKTDTDKITTSNVVDNETVITQKVFWGYIKSWDATHINVYAWEVPGSGNCPIPNKHCDVNKIPNIANIDTQLSNYNVPMIFVGVSPKIFTKNTFVNFDGQRVLGDKATAVANQYEREEFDFRAKNWKKPNSLSFHGWTTSFQCGSSEEDKCDTRAVSDDSYAYLVNGPNGLPKAYVAQMGGDALEFSGYSTFIGGPGAPLQVDDKGNSSIGGQGSNHIMSSFASGLPSNNTIHMSNIINRDVALTNDWRDYSVRLVMDIDSTRDRRAGLVGGSQKGSIVFNYNGASHDGGICLLGFNQNPGLCQEGDGSVNFAKTVTAQSNVILNADVNIKGMSNLNGGATFNAHSFINSGKLLVFQSDNNRNAVYLSTQYKYTDADKAANKEDTRGDLWVGTQVANGGNIRGVKGYYGQTATLTNSISALKIIGQQLHIQLSTPSSSSEPCSAGDIKDDKDYHYVCVEDNKWKRVALSDF